jgi:predicted nucleic acid-binding protein
MIRSTCDTGPLLHLTEADSLDLLRITGEVHAPPQVAAELIGHLPEWEMPLWLNLTSLDRNYDAEMTGWLQADLLHWGEAAAIALARQIQADWLLTDDASARLFARELGLEVHGSLGVILWAASNKYVDRVTAERALARLAASSLWLSSRVQREAEAALAEIYG